MGAVQRGVVWSASGFLVGMALAALLLDGGFSFLDASRPPALVVHVRNEGARDLDAAVSVILRDAFVDGRGGPLARGATLDMAFPDLKNDVYLLRVTWTSRTGGPGGSRGTDEATLSLANCEGTDHAEFTTDGTAVGNGADSMAFHAHCGA